jgi:acyl-homoserine lactone acylase PvdQ
MRATKLFLISSVIPLLLGALIYYYMQSDILGNKTLIRNSFEDIDISLLDHGFKVVEAKTYLGAIYGMGFALASDRLW